MLYSLQVSESDLKETVSTPDTPREMTIVEDQVTSSRPVEEEVIAATKAILECIRLRDFDGYK